MNHTAQHTHTAHWRRLSCHSKLSLWPSSGPTAIPTPTPTLWGFRRVTLCHPQPHLPRHRPASSLSYLCRRPLLARDRRTPDERRNGFCARSRFVLWCEAATGAARWFFANGTRVGATARSCVGLASLKDRISLAKTPPVPLCRRFHGRSDFVLRLDFTLYPFTHHREIFRPTSTLRAINTHSYSDTRATCSSPSDRAARAGSPRN